jgi:putative peptide zinc metalloprotease protein
MDPAEDSTQALPRSRIDVEWTEQVYYGKGCYVLKDPASLRYYRLRPPEHTIYKMLDGKATMDSVLAELKARFPDEEYDRQAVMSFVIMLRGANLLHIPGETDTDYLLKRKKILTRNIFKRITQEYLFFKIPVFDPDKLLNGLMQMVGGVIFSRFMMIFSWIMLGGAVLLVLNNIDKIGQAQPILSWDNMILLVPSLLFIKLIHEFGHGLSAKYFGSEVHEMGILVLVFAPFFYCDVSDAWMIPEKRKRMWITAAGIVVEIFLAGVATYIWAFTMPKTVINQFALNIMLAASLNTLLFNGNPLLRFDGYYYLMDWVEIPNLKQKGTGYLWYLLQRYVLGVENPQQPIDVAGREFLVVFYAIASFIYRCFIMVAIITLVWQFLDPYGWGIIGVFMAVAAIYSALIKPLIKFAKFVFTQRHRIQIRLATACILVLFVGGASYFLLGFPIEQTVDAQCVIRPKKIHVLYVSQPGFVRKETNPTFVVDGQKVAEGEVLLELSDPELEAQAQLNDLRWEELQKRKAEAVSRNHAGAERKAKYDLIGLQAQRDQTNQRVEKLTLRSPISGCIQLRTNERLDNLDGRFMAVQTPLLAVYEPDEFEAIAVVNHRDIGLIQARAAQIAEVKLWSMDNEVFESEVAIDESPENVRRMSSAVFSTVYGGDISTMPSATPKEALEPAESVYEINIPLQDSRLRDGMVGQAKIIIGDETLWGLFTRWFLQTIRQEFRI